MSTKNELKEITSRYKSAEYKSAAALEIIAEVLIDIRDLLAKPKVEISSVDVSKGGQICTRCGTVILGSHAC